MIITSSQNSRIKLARSLLSSKKEREKNKLFVIEGVRLAEEAMTAGAIPNFVLYSSQISDRGFEIVEFLQSQGIQTDEVDKELLNRVSDTRTSQGILAALPYPKESPIMDNHNVLVLDQISNPGNLGTLLRTAAGMDFTTVIMTVGSADAYSPKVVRSAMGAHFKCSLLVTEVEEIQNFCKTINISSLEIILADAQAEKACWDMDLSQPIALVIGSEAAGPSFALKSVADQTVAIPMQSGSESFNAAVSGSILMYEIYRQRNSR